VAPTSTDFVSEAASFIGTPYVWGGASPKGFDCSGLVQYSLERLGLRKVPRTSERQWDWVDRVSSENVEAGDLVFFHFPGEDGAGHVAIYAGKGRRGGGSVIQAPRPGEDVQRVPFTPLPAGSSEWGGRIVGYGRVPGLSYKNATLEALWIHAGGPPKVARTMAAIALAESGGKVGAVGGPNDDGSYDYGLWQINSSHAYSRARLLHDPGYNARAAVAVYRSQGLTAWSSYSNGRYRSYLANAATATPVGRPPRPGAGGSGGGGGSDAAGSSSSADNAAAADAQAAAWSSYIQEGQSPGVHAAGPGVQPASLDLNPLPWGPHLAVPGTGWIPNLPSIPDPFKVFGEAGAAVNDLGTFLKWVAWLFSPKNILRIVEFVTGAGLMLVAAYFASQGFKSSSSSSSSSSGGPSGIKKAAVKRAVRATPPGRALALAGAAQRGRRKAAGARRQATSKARRAEEKRAEKRAQAGARQAGETRRGARARRRSEGEIPF
jgi:hypothetical protein